MGLLALLPWHHSTIQATMLNLAVFVAPPPFILQRCGHPLPTHIHTWGPPEWAPIPYLPSEDVLVHRMEKQWGSLHSDRGINSTIWGTLLFFLLFLSPPPFSQRCSHSLPPAALGQCD